MIHRCPCCGAPTDTPTPEAAAAQYGLPRVEFDILKAIWNGKGKPVSVWSIAEAVYSERDDGGPQGADALLRTRIFHLRRKLEGSGIAILRAGYGEGYRLKLETGNGRVTE